MPFQSRGRMPLLVIRTLLIRKHCFAPSATASGPSTSSPWESLPSTACSWRSSANCQAVEPTQSAPLPLSLSYTIAAWWMGKPRSMCAAISSVRRRLQSRGDCWRNWSRPFSDRTVGPPTAMVLYGMTHYLVRPVEQHTFRLL